MQSDNQKQTTINRQLEFIKRIKSLADLGLKYSEDEYNAERYSELKEISLKLMSEVSEKPLETLKDFFLPEKDYPTPKIDIRGFVLNNKKQILFVKEKIDGKWTIPGGWGDIGFSPSEVVVKEIQEETGLKASTQRLLAVYDKKCHPHPPQPFYVYKMVFFCELINNTISKGFDIEDVGFFAINNLPELSKDRILKSQIEQLYDKVINNDISVFYD